MDRALPAVIITLALLALLALMLRSWRRRTRRDAGLAAGYPAPAGPGRELASVPVLYVATTPRDQPLERLAVRGLGFRAQGTLVVADDGVWMLLDGGTEVFVPVAAIDLLARATWTIDRVVETDGLLVLGWRLAAVGDARTAGTDGAAADSYFRIVDPADRARVIDAIHSIAPGATRPAGTTESEA